jgi:hypothetical protein
MKKPKPTADATEAAPSSTKEPDGLATIGDLLEDMDRLRHRQGVLSALLEYLYENFLGVEREAPKARIARADGSEVPPREDVVTAIAEELSRAGAGTRDRLSAILATRLQGRPTRTAPCVSPDPEERGHPARSAGADPLPPRAATSRRAHGSRKRSSSRKQPATKAPTA